MAMGMRWDTTCLPLQIFIKARNRNLYSPEIAQTGNPPLKNQHLPNELKETSSLHPNLVLRTHSQPPNRQKRQVGATFSLQTSGSHDAGPLSTRTPVIAAQ